VWPAVGHEPVWQSWQETKSGGGAWPSDCAECVKAIVSVYTDVHMCVHTYVHLLYVFIRKFWEWACA
jgi:hypothetical protein